MNFRFFLLLYLCLSTSAAIGVAQTKTHHLNMQQAISRALKMNNQVRSSQFSVKKANWDKKRAWMQLFPSLDMSSRYVRIDDRTFAERDFRRYLPDVIKDEFPQTVFQESFYTSFDATLPLFNTALLNNLSVAKENEKMFSHLDKSTRDNIIFQVITGYLDVLRSNDVLKLQDEYLELSRLLLEKAKRLQSAGRYSKAEALRWNVDFQRQRAVLSNSETALRSANTNLSRLLNFANGEAVETVDQVPIELIQNSESVAQLTDAEILQLIDLDDAQMIKVNAALAAARSNEKMSKLLYRNAYNSFLPIVSVNYSYEWRENNSLWLDEYSPKTLAISLNVPIFNSFQKVAAAKSAYYDYRSSQEQFYDQLQNTRFVLTETANRMISLKTQRELAKSEVDYNEQNYRIVLNQREKGLLSNLDFIDAKLNLQNAKLNDISVHYDFISAMVELYYLLGNVESVIQIKNL